MTGLLRKELYTFGYFKRTILIAFAMAALFGFVLNDGYATAPSFITLLLMATCQSLYRFDETSRWDRYALAMPCGPKRIVGARYLFQLLIAAVSSLLGIIMGSIIAIIQGISNWLPALLGTTGVMMLVYLLVAALSGPLAYKLGSEKSRFILIGIFLLPYMGAITLIPWIEENLGGLPVGPVWVLVLPAALLVAALYIGSWALSCRIYAKKEF